MKDHPSIRLYAIVIAFQSFAGKPLRATDHAGALTIEQLDAMERGLQAISRSLRQEDPIEWSDLHRLADQIDKWVPPATEPLLTTEQTRMADELRGAGYTIGDRNPVINTAFKGRFMVADLDGWDGCPTEDARSLQFAVVGDDLGSLIEGAYHSKFG